MNEAKNSIHNNLCRVGQYFKKRIKGQKNHLVTDRSTTGHSDNDQRNAFAGNEISMRNDQVSNQSGPSNSQMRNYTVGTDQVGIISSPRDVQWQADVNASSPVLQNMKWIMTSDAHECDRLIAALMSQMDDKQYVGLDIEWDPVFRKGGKSRTALLQVGIHSGHCVLTKVHKMRFLPSSLEKLLCDPSIIKVGVGIRDDVRKIFDEFRVKTNGYFDLRNIAPKSEKNSLAALVANHLGVTIPKSKKLVMKKWSGDLTPQRQAYAARDAYVAALLLPKLVSLKFKIPESSVSQNDIVTAFKQCSQHTTRKR